MEIEELKLKLIEAYSLENLNELTSSIISFYKNKQNSALIRICNLVNNFYTFAEPSDTKLFSKLILLYHPDRIAQIHKTIAGFNSKEELNFLMHIFVVRKNLDQLVLPDETEVLSPQDFEEEYGWNYQSTESDYFIVRDDDETVIGYYDDDDDVQYGYAQELEENSFLGAVKRKIYGASQINFPVHLLEDMQEIEMVEYEIENLDGIEYCNYVQILDLSYNNIFDISKLEYCTLIQELYLSDNDVHYIDSLYHLPDLRVVDLSNNSIQNITPLLHHTGLDFVNLMGNPVPKSQIDQLKGKGVVVVF